MGAQDFITLLGKHRLVALDTCCFIYHFEANRRYLPLTRVLFRHIEEGVTSAVTSSLTLTELLTGPKRLSNDALAQEYQEILAIFPNLEIVPVDWEIAARAADFRAEFSLRTPDALQLATAVCKGATLFISNDQRFKKVDVIGVALLDDYL